MSLNLITPVFYEKNFFDEKGTLHQEKQIIKGRFIYIIDKFTKDKPDSVSEYYANSKGKLCRWDNSIKDWTIIPIKQGKYYFYEIETMHSLRLIVYFLSKKNKKEKK